MRKRIKALLSRQEARYILVGLTQLLLDWTLFVVLTATGVPTALANTLGRVLIAILGFLLHGRYTFGDAEARRLGWGRFARFATVWVSLTACSTLAMYLVRSEWNLYIAWAAKPFVELAIAVVSYLLLKRWVYR
jgi:putative flippase GtrA